jgi:cyclin-dependent kinase 8/11
VWLGITNQAGFSRFKPDKEGEVIQYTGISQSACREMAVCSLSLSFSLH